MLKKIPLLLCGLTLSLAAPTHAEIPEHTFEIGENDFLIDGKPTIIRCGEIHFARVPQEYWRHRLKAMRAMGMNTVCAYLFWNFHEFEKGTYNWEGQADVAEFCRIAQEEDLWVILRPGPYACAEWDGGGLPWWLLKNPDIRLRSRDPDFLEPATAWLKEVGRELGPLQVTNGGPILMVQVENEYGFYGEDAEYMGKIRDALLEAGFDVPLFACNPPYTLTKGLRADLFQVVNFGNDPADAFKKLREIQKDGPLMCGEFYPGWFDTWGSPHHTGDTRKYLENLEYMLENRASFSIYMAHGGTTFGLWAGADRPFKPDTSSYDYDAPVSEAGWLRDKFHSTRELMSRYLEHGETLPEPPEPLPVMSLPEITLDEIAPVFANLPEPVRDDSPRDMEAYDQGQGMLVYRASLPAGPPARLEIDQVHDFAWVFVDGEQVGVMDRRSRRFTTHIPAREAPARLDILVEAMGHVNFGNEIHDRKGIHGSVNLTTPEDGETKLEGPWEIFNLHLDEAMIAGLKWERAGPPAAGSPAYRRGTFDVSEPADTFLDLRTWGKGVIWINGRTLARYWNIGPTQTAFLPGAWLKKGANEIVVLDLLGPSVPRIAGLETPILNLLRPELDFARSTRADATLKIDDREPALENSFEEGPAMQEVMLARPVTGRQFCIESLNAHDGKKFASIAEFDLLDPEGKSISHQKWTIAYASSEELVGEDGSATNAIDGQTNNFWHSEWQSAEPDHPHQLVIDLGEETDIAGFRYTPRPGNDLPGRIKDYRIYIGNDLVDTD